MDESQRKLHLRKKLDEKKKIIMDRIRKKIDARKLEIQDKYKLPLC